MVSIQITTGWLITLHVEPFTNHSCNVSSTMPHEQKKCVKGWVELTDEILLNEKGTKEANS